MWLKGLCENDKKYNVLIKMSKEIFVWKFIYKDNLKFLSVTGGMVYQFILISFDEW